MKVLFLASWYPSERAPSHGIFIREHARAASMVADVQVLHYRPPEPGLAPAPLTEISDIALTGGLKTYRVEYGRPLPGTGYASLVWTVRRAVRQIANDGFVPDVVHANVYDTGVPALLSRPRGVPVVISEHYSAFALGRLGRIELAKAKWAFRRAAFVMPVSGFLRDSIRAHGIDARFELVSNAVDPGFFYPGSSDRVPGPARLLFVGGLSTDDAKGAGLLIDALLQRGGTDWSLTLIGDGPGLDPLEVKVREAGLAEQVVFRGWQDRRGVSAAMRQADVLVLPSRLEMQPCVVLEALASGLPVLASNVGGIPEVVTPECGWLLERRDIMSLSAMLSSVLPSLIDLDRDRVATCGRKYHVDAIGLQLRDVYTRAMNLGPA